MLSQWFKGGLFVYAAAIPLWIVLRILYLRARRRSGKIISPKREFLILLFVVYVLSIGISTLLPIPMTHSEGEHSTGFNLVPIVNSLKHYHYAREHGEGRFGNVAMENIIGNILLFIPLGIFLPLIFSKIRLWHQVLLTGFLCSVSIETIQFISGFLGISRTVDVDDVISNTLGTVIGFVLLKLFTSRGDRRELRRSVA